MNTRKQKTIEALLLSSMDETTVSYTETVLLFDSKTMDKNNISRLKDKVEWCLKNYVWTRNCEIELLWCVWQEFYEVDTMYISKADMKKMPTQESIKRLRAKFNSE